MVVVATDVVMVVVAMVVVRITELEMVEVKGVVIITELEMVVLVDVKGVGKKEKAWECKFHHHMEALVNISRHCKALVNIFHHHKVVPVNIFHPDTNYKSIHERNLLNNPVVAMVVEMGMVGMEAARGHKSMQVHNRIREVRVKCREERVK